VEGPHILPQAFGGQGKAVRHQKGKGEGREEERLGVKSKQDTFIHDQATEEEGKA